MVEATLAENELTLTTAPDGLDVDRVDGAHVADAGLQDRPQPDGAGGVDQEPGASGGRDHPVALGLG
jgi:hypothetical protein